MKKRTYQTMSEFEIGLLKRLLSNGAKLKEIKKQLNCGDWKIRNNMKKLGLIMPCKIFKEQMVCVQITVKRKYYNQAFKDLNEKAKPYKL